MRKLLLPRTLLHRSHKQGAPRIAVHKRQQAEREGKGTLHAFVLRRLLIGVECEIYRAGHAQRASVQPHERSLPQPANHRWRDQWVGCGRPWWAPTGYAPAPLLTHSPADSVRCACTGRCAVIAVIGIIIALDDDDVYYRPLLYTHTWAATRRKG